MRNLLPSLHMGLSLFTHTSHRQVVKAAGNGDLKRLSLELEQGSDVLLEGAARGQRTAWHSAAKHGQLSALMLLEEIFKRPGGITYTYSTYRAVSATAVLLSLLDASDKQGVTPLMIACKKGHAECVRYLLSKVSLRKP